MQAGALLQQPLHCRVFAYLDSRSLLSAIRVCRCWQRDAGAPGVQRALTLRRCHDAYDADLRHAVVAQYLRQLKSIALQRCDNIGEAGFETIATHCSALRSLSVRWMHLSASSFRAIATMGLLESLDLSHSTVSGGSRVQRLKWERRASRSRCGAVFTTRTVMFAPGAGRSGCAFLPRLHTLVLHDAEAMQRAVLSIFPRGRLRPPELLLSRCVALREISLSQWSGAEVHALCTRPRGAAALHVLTIHEARLSTLGLFRSSSAADLTVALHTLRLHDVDIRPGRFARRASERAGKRVGERCPPALLLAQLLARCPALRHLALEGEFFSLFVTFHTIPAHNSTRSP